MIYEIEPLDNFFFRSPAPFEAGGETTVSHSIFPPLPSTYAGALRPLVKQEEASMRGIKVGWNGLIWKRENSNPELCFPMPKDLYITDQNKEGQWNLNKKIICKKNLSNYPLDYIIGIGETEAPKPEKEVVPYMQEHTMRSYLNANEDPLTCMDLSEKLFMEPRVGIEIDRNSKVSKDQRIYTTLCIRPKPEIRLAVEIQGDIPIEQAVIRLGGEGKLANAVRSACHLDMEAEPGNSRYFKLYLATPAVFRNGWIPGWINRENNTGYFSFRNKAVNVKLMGACVGKPLPCGSFGYVKDDKTGERKYRPRELRFAVPAGSVYYFELRKGKYEDAVKLFHNKCISDYRDGLGFDYQVFNRTRYCDRGFGYSLIGKLSKEQEDMLHV